MCVCLQAWLTTCQKLLSWDLEGSDLGGWWGNGGGVTYEGKARLFVSQDEGGFPDTSVSFPLSFLKGRYCSRESQREVRGINPSQGILGSTGCSLDSRLPS